MKIPIFPVKYHQNGGFSMAMLVHRSVHFFLGHWISHWIFKSRSCWLHWSHSDWVGQNSWKGKKHVSNKKHPWKNGSTWVELWVKCSLNINVLSQVTWNLENLNEIERMEQGRDYLKNKPPLFKLSLLLNLVVVVSTLVAVAYITWPHPFLYLGEVKMQLMQQYQCLQQT